MSNSVQLPNQYESPQSFLDEAYRVLEYEKGALFNATRFPDDGSGGSMEWLEKGDWLALAYEVGAQKVFFVDNDPIIVFFKLTSNSNVEEQITTFRRAWCMARPICLFMAFPGELRVYSLNQRPVQNIHEWEAIKPLQIVKKIVEIAELLYEYRREQVESRLLFADDRFGSVNERADKYLIRDLKVVRQWLLQTGLETKYVHALIGRSIFIRYLEDRQILTRFYFEQVAEGNPYWQELLSRKLEKPNGVMDWEQCSYHNVLLDKDFTYALFNKLSDDFNGDMFPKDTVEENRVHQKEHLEPLRGFLLGDPDPHRPTLFFWAYDFKIIPIELISSIYEEFYHSNNLEDSNGTYYTPSVLVEYVLSQVLEEDRLATNPRVLDPACGSGIFLVESFRRIVRYQVAKERKMIASESLRRILREQIVGIEINEEAVRITAFSLYLALLHYQEPKDILENKRLPNLIYLRDREKDNHHYQILFHANAFGLTPEEKISLQEQIAQKKAFKGRTNIQLLLAANQDLDVELQSFDIIVGNPPWSEVNNYVKPVSCGSRLPLRLDLKPFKYDRELHTLSIVDQVRPSDLIKAKQFFPTEYHDLLNDLKVYSDECFQALRWADAYKKVVGDKSYSQLFIYRALSLIKPDGFIGLLVHSNVLFNERQTSQEFRQIWLSSAKINQIVNFTHVRKLFFDKSIAPFVFTLFQPLQNDLAENSVCYASAFFTKAAEQLHSVILTKADVHLIKQMHLREKDYLWKAYWLGNHHDAALLATLDMEYRLANFLDPDIKPGYGFQFGSKLPSTKLQTLRVLKSRHLSWYGPLREEWFESRPHGVGRTPDERLYEGQRLLISTGIKADYGISVRLEYEDFSFRHGLYSIPLPSLPDWKAKLILGVFWSALGRYRMFMTSSRWGVWFDQVLSDDILSMPVRIPKQINSVVENIIQIVDKIRVWEPRKIYSWGDIGFIDESPDTFLIRSLDKAIFELFRLSIAEQDIIKDFFEYKFDLLNKGADSTALEGVRPLNASYGTINSLSSEPGQYELKNYLYAFLQMWNRELGPEGEFSWQVIHRRDAGMVAVIFTTQVPGMPPLKTPSSDEEEWNDILERCAKALRQPISQRIYIDGIVRAVTDTNIIIIKREERRLWTCSAAREDVEATLLQAMYLQDEAMSESNR